jgi:hypothetical protein
VLVFCSETLSTARMEMQQVQAMVDGTMQTLRSHPRVGPDVPIVVAIEGCAGDTLYLPEKFLKYGPNVLVMNEVCGGKRYGVPKTERSTREMVTTVYTMLSLGLVSIPADAVAFATEYAAKKKSMRDFRECLLTQFASFRLDPTSGKMSGKGHGANDDLIVTFMMALYWMTRFAVNEKELYVDFKDMFDPVIWKKGSCAGIEETGEQVVHGGKKKKNSALRSKL